MSDKARQLDELQKQMDAIQTAMNLLGEFKSLVFQNFDKESCKEARQKFLDIELGLMKASIKIVREDLLGVLGVEVIPPEKNEQPID